MLPFSSCCGGQLVRSQIMIEELETGEEIARCPSCSLFITVIYDDETIQTYKSQMKS